MFRKKTLLFLIILVVSCTIVLQYLLYWSKKYSNRKHAYNSLKMKERIKRRYEGELEKYLVLDLMRELKEMRPLFNFTMMPMKIDARNAMMKSSYQAIQKSMIILIKSHFDNFNERQLARQTWASYKNIHDFQFRTVFIVGMPETNEEKMELEEENHEYRDLLQINITETYRNVVYKTLAGMQWATENLPDDWFYSSADDDIMPDLMSITEELEEMMKEEQEARELAEKTSKDRSKSDEIRSTNFELPIYCAFNYSIRTHPKRKEDSKWFINERQYPLKLYPPYCFGGFYTMTVKVASILYELSRKLTLFWIDDLWVTGIIRLKYFSSDVSNCHICKIYNLTTGLWLGNHGKIITGNATTLLKKWDKILHKLSNVEN